MSDDGPRRFREPSVLPSWHDPVFVVCPRCRARALVFGPRRGAARMTCPSCASVRDSDQLRVRIGGRDAQLKWAGGSWMDPRTGRHLPEYEYETAEGTDPRFGVSLWLRTTCAGHLLWANNADHLDYLESYIAAALRERRPGPATLQWYLPSWMKHAKNRGEILRAITRLRASMAEGADT